MSAKQVLCKCSRTHTHKTNSKGCEFYLLYIQKHFCRLLKIILEKQSGEEEKKEMCFFIAWFLLNLILFLIDQHRVSVCIFSLSIQFRFELNTKFKRQSFFQFLNATACSSIIWPLDLTSHHRFVNHMNMSEERCSIASRRRKKTHENHSNSGAL